MASRPRGFTLIELMATLVIVALLTAIALPSYSRYVMRSRIPVGLDALSSLQTRMEQLYQDTGNYGTAACGVSMPTAANYTVTCSLTSAGQGFTATAMGSGPVVGTSYSIDNTGTRRTLAHPDGVPSTNCWTIGGGKCDS